MSVTETGSGSPPSRGPTAPRRAKADRPLPSGDRSSGPSQVLRDFPSYDLSDYTTLSLGLAVDPILARLAEPTKPHPEPEPAPKTESALISPSSNNHLQLTNSSDPVTRPVDQLDMSYLTSQFGQFGPPALSGTNGWLPSGSGSSTGHSHSASTQSASQTYPHHYPSFSLNLPSPVLAKQPLPINSPHSPPNDLPDLIPDNGMSPPEASPFQSFAHHPQPRPVSDPWRHHSQYSSQPLPLSIAPSASVLSPVPGYQLSNVSRAPYPPAFTAQDELFARAQSDDLAFATGPPKRPLQHAWAHGLGSPVEEVRSTVSPQEAFLDYDDQSHRLQDAGLGAQSSLFAPLPASYSHSLSQSPALAPIPVSFSPPSGRSSFSSQDRYSLSPSSGMRLSPRLRPASSPVSGWHQPASAQRKSHPFSVPQNAVSWNQHYDNDGASFNNDFDEPEETPLATSFDMNDPFPNLELEPIPVLGGQSIEAKQADFFRSVQAEEATLANAHFGRPILPAAPGSPALKAEPAPPTTAGGSEWTSSHPRRGAAQNAIALLQQRLSDSDPFGEEEDGEEVKKVARRRKPKKENGDGNEEDGGEYTPSRSSRPISPDHSNMAPLPALPDAALGASASRKRSPPAAFDDDDSLSSLPDEDDPDRDADFSDQDAEGDLDPDHHPDDDDDPSSPQARAPRRRSHKVKASHGGGAGLQPNKRRRRIPVATHGHVPAGALRCTLPAVAEEGEGQGVCGVVFRRPYDLARHKETIHGVGNGDKAPRKSDWRCAECDGMFSRKDALIRHARIRGHDAGLE